MANFPRAFEQVALYLKEPKNLRRIGLILFIPCVGGGWYFKRKIEKTFMDGDYVVKTKEIFRKYQYAGQILGHPYRIQKANLGDTDVNYVYDTEASVYLPVKGPLRKCYLQAWSSREKPGSSWDVDKLDMTCEEKIWTVYINPKKQDTIHPTLSPEQQREKEAELQKVELQKAEEAKIPTNTEEVKSNPGWWQYMTSYFRTG